MKKKNILVLVLILIVLIGTGIGGFFLVKSQMNEKVYKEKMEEGKRYFTRMQYDQAIAAFEFALEKNPEDENVYVSIYRVRVAQGQTQMAISILEEGIRKTQSVRLSDMLARYVEKVDTTETEAVDTTNQPVNFEGESASVSINTAMLQKLKNYTYAGYEKEFGRYISNDMKGGSLEVTHGQIQAVFFYQDLPGEEKSIDGAHKEPMDNAKPVYIRLQNPGLLFKNFKNGVTLKRLEEIVGTKITSSYSDEAGSYVDKFSYGGCDIEIACEENGDILSTSAWNKIIPPRGVAQGTKVSVEGVIVNAVTGQGLPGAALKFKPDDRNTEEEEVTTDRSGSFGAELEPGKYEVEVSCNGFITDSFELEVEAAKPVSGINFPLSPTLASGEIRIVLTWNAYPSDLDSHLSGTSATGKGIDIYYGRRDASDGSQPIASLDVDETSGFGPETTTIYMDGDYRFWVEDFTHTGDMGNSGAQVKVYTGNGGAPQVFDVPSGSGNTWDVFTIKNGEIHPTNTIS